jgi:hypothetical protein
MKKLAILFAGLFIMAISVQNVNAQDEATTAGDASATIIETISIVKDIELRFGVFQAIAAQTDLVISPDGVLTSNGISHFGNHQAGTFDVSGAPDATYAITLPDDGAVTLAPVSGSAPAMAVKDFTSNPTPTGTLNNAGEQTINVGGTLVVGSNATQLPGLYEGTYNVTVAYN